MVRPVHVTFRNMRPHAALEEIVRARAAWLETFHPDIVGCRVLIETPHRHREHGQHVHIRVDLALPGEDVVVNHEPTLHAGLRDVEERGHHKGDDVRAFHKYAEAAVRAAFSVARRRLQDVARRQRGDVKTHIRRELPSARSAAASGRPSSHRAGPGAQPPAARSAPARRAAGSRQGA